MNKNERMVIKKNVYENLIKNGPSKFKLMFDPTGYVRGAIDCLETQLKNARTENRKKTLQRRIDSWKSELKILENMETKNIKSEE
jgi:hypothetical protein